MRKARVLVVDDEILFRKSLERLLRNQNFEVISAATFEEAKQLLFKQPVHVVLLDLILPDRSGMDMITLIKKRFSPTEVIVLTGYGSIDSAVEATKRGAFSYLPKPFEPEVLNISLRNALETVRLKSENLRLQDSLKREYRFANIVGASSAMQNVFRTIEKVANTDATVLITGESGTGKELIARAIHYSSHRSKHHLITINCGAIPEDLLESELFGHVKGAFTGAIANRVGRFEAANHGTIFLDEIGDTPLNIQVKLLRVLQEKTFELVGSSQPIEVDVRIIAATNQDLRQLISQNRFREDVFYRLNVIPIELPPIRQRKEDIPLLIRHVLQRTCHRQKRALLEITPEAFHLLVDYPWPGNVRELENVIEQMVIFSEGKRIRVEDLPGRFLRIPNPQQQTDPSRPIEPPSLIQPNTTTAEPGIDFNTTVDQFEQSLILQALKMTQGNKNRAAKLLKLNRTTLVEKMRKKGLLKGASRPSASPSS